MVNPSATYLHGSSNGARIGGLILGGAWLLVALSPVFVGSGTLALLPLCPLFLYWMIRPWFMGVWLSDHEVVICSWYRTYRIPVEDVASASVTGYLGLLSKGVIRWIPFVGPVGTLFIAQRSGRRRDYPGTIARRKQALRLAWHIRQHAGIDRPRSDGNVLE